MPLTAAQKVAILTNHPYAHAVWTEDDGTTERIVILTNQNTPTKLANLPTKLYGLPVRLNSTPPIRDLRLRLPTAEPEPAPPLHPQHRSCHNEPIPGGVQLQPKSAPWVGTLGTACRFFAPDDVPKWGILSNWHVMAYGTDPIGRPQHQPTDSLPPVAHLTDTEPVCPDCVNHFDAAVADAKISGFHTVGPQLLDAGPVGPKIAPPQVRLAVCKSGRTTGLTRGTIQSTNAAVKVDYGDFIANFADQVIIFADSGQFSAPGDSGSLVFTPTTYSPVALLFAGGGNVTVANPLAPIAARFGLDFSF